MPFTADEFYTTNPPGFVWTAMIDFTGGIPVIGQDRYIEGVAALEMRLLGVIPVASDSGLEMNEGDLLRYLNETVLFPADALSPYITGESVDDMSARATMEYEGSRGPGTIVPYRLCGQTRTPSLRFRTMVLFKHSVFR